MTLAGRCAPRASVPRRAVCAWLALCLLGATGKTRASSYADRALLLIGEANRANDYLAKRLYDRELARLVARDPAPGLSAACAATGCSRRCRPPPGG